MLSTTRLTPILLAVFLLLATIFFLNSSPATVTPYPSEVQLGSAPAVVEGGHDEHVPPPPVQAPIPVQQPPAQASPATGTGAVAVSYDKTTPPTIGCESIVSDLQRQLIEAYQVELKGIRYANIYGYLETGNKGDAAIWAAQQILLSTMGITPMEACRFLDQECDLDKFNASLAEHRPHAAILMAGGGNFNDYYHTDHPSRLKMVDAFKNTPIRAFPQSIHMTKPDTIKSTAEIFGAHSDLHLAARDLPSYDWLEKEFGANPAAGTAPNKVKHILAPDIAFMFGNRPDFRLNTKKTHQILILARDDKEVAEGNSAAIPMGVGLLDLGGAAGNVTYLKLDWEYTKTPGIDNEVANADGTKTTVPTEHGKNQRAWAKAMQGFEMLAAADLVITDRLHGHIMSTIIGVPHILMDSKLKKNLHFHATWTKDCGCTRIADNIGEAKNFARMFFEQQKKEGSAT